MIYKNMINEQIVVAIGILIVFTSYVIGYGFGWRDKQDLTQIERTQLFESGHKIGFAESAFRQKEWLACEQKLLHLK